MHVRRTILCLATIFFWAAHDPDVAYGQSSELMEAVSTFKSLYQQGRYSEAEPHAEKASGPESDFGDEAKNQQEFNDQKNLFQDSHIRIITRDRRFVRNAVTAWPTSWPAGCS